MAKGQSVYLHLQQQQQIKTLQRSWLWRSELPTWALIVAVYGSWVTTLFYCQMLGLPVATLLLALITCCYLSLQHELIHGHPTRWPRVNQLLGTLPLAVWYPYGLYRDSHLAHHQNHALTLPQEDPETYYFHHQHWLRLHRWQQRLVRTRNTFAGRLVLGPLFDIASTLHGMVQAFRRGDGAAMAMWLFHALLLAVTLSWVAAQEFPVWLYLLGVSYPALALTKVRSFFEHRAADDPLARSVINEASLPWRLLFLNLNYHSIHHDLPGVPWYALRKLYLQDREGYQRRNHGFVVRGYGEWLRRFLFTPVEVTAHPATNKENEPDG